MSHNDDLILVAPMAGWAMPLAGVPDPVFADGMMGAGLAIDPTGDTLCAPCEGVVESIHAARHAVTLKTACGAELLMHVGIDSVAMGGEGFTALVTPGSRVAQGQALIRFDLDRLVCRASAAVTPILVVNQGFDVVSLTSDRQVEIGDPVLRLTRVAHTVSEAATLGHTGSVARAIIVALPHGIHARPAARIAAAVRGRQASVTLVRDDRRASALSITGMLGLGAVHGASVSIEAEGVDAALVVDAVADILTATVDPDAAPRAPAQSPSVASPVQPGAMPGVGAVPGVALGIARWLRAAPPAIPASIGTVAEERASLSFGIARLRTELDGIGGVMAAHRALLDDPELLSAIEGAVNAGQGAVAAVLRVTGAQAKSLAAMDDPRIAERGADLLDIGERLGHAILGTAPQSIRLDPGTVLIADDLLPSQFSALAGAVPAGIAVVRGGPTSHVAIMAAGQGIPMVVALGDALSGIADGTTLVVDGDAGTILVDPDADALVDTQKRISRARDMEARAMRTIGRGTATRDGHRVAVQVNLGNADEAARAVATGAEGCGLLRTELMFLDRDTAPTRDSQAGDYRAIAAAMSGRPLTIRLLDVGGDKPASYLSIPHEENPALGLRGVRVTLAQPELLEAQIGAIVDAADAGDCRIMVPMVASVAEIDAVRIVLDRLRGDRRIPLGAMIETPAAAIGADLIAARTDFLSIGSNDLTQYALAMDRGNPAVASGIDGLHPAVLRLIAATCEGAAKHGVPVGLCGGLAADPLAVPILIGLGVASLSVPPGRIAATRALVGELSHAAASDHAHAALACESAAAVRAFARTFAEGEPA